MELKDIERKISEYALHKSLRESFNPRDNNCGKQDNGQIMLNEKEINLFGELERKNRLHQESYAKSCKEIEDLKGSCCEEENEVTQPNLNACSVQHGRESQTVSPLGDQVRKLQERLDFLKDVQEFHPDASSSSGRSHVPLQPLIASSSRRKPSSESGLLRNTREEVSVLHTFLPANLFDKILTTCTMTQEIWQYRRE